MKLQVINEEGNKPKHIAIIMDGNGRWARSRGLPRAYGHKKGAETLRIVVESALKLDVKYLTLFGFSSENWNRPKDEVIDLMSLLRGYLVKEVEALDKKGIKFRVVGDRQRLDCDIVEMINSAEKLTADNAELTLTLALSYGGRRAISDAAKKLAMQVYKKQLNPNEICLIALPAAKPPKPKARVGTKPLLPTTTPASIAIDPQTTEGVSRFERVSSSVFPHDRAGAIAIINSKAKPIGVDIFTK